MKNVFLLCAFSLMLAGCVKNQPACVEGSVKDFRGFDGCRMVIVLNDGRMLEPVKLPEGTTLVANKKACLVYKEKSQASICMIGPTVEIISLKYLEP